jgi:anaphase-promoting complex subunit 3
VEALKQYSLSENIDPKNGMNKYEKANSLVKIEQYDAALGELKQLELMLPKEP